MFHDKQASTVPTAEQNATGNEAIGTSRRRFLTGSAVAVGAGAAAAVGFPSIAVAQTTTLRFQSTWPNQDIFHEFAADYVRIVNEMSGGRLRLNLLPRRGGGGGPATSGRGDLRRPGRRPRGDGLLVRQAQGLLAVRHPPALRLGRQ